MDKVSRVYGLGFLLYGILLRGLLQNIGDLEVEGRME